MIEALETPRLILEAKEKMEGPLLDSRRERKVVFVGDTHTAVDLTQTIFDKYYADSDLVVFLGDYVDRGETGVENLGLITSKFLEDPSKLIMLRGNHESPLTNPDYPTAFQLLWNDPRDMIEGFIPSVRGDGAYYYGSDVTEKFLANNSLKGIIRVHEVVDGFREDLDGKVITIFSSKYHGGAAGVLILDGDKMEQVRL